MLSARTIGTVTAAVLAAALAVPALSTAAQADTRPTAVVSLGDSAISGEGAGDYEAGTNGENGNWCHRSANALIHKTALADKTVNLACSGADASNVSLADTTHYTEGSQARRLIQVATENRVTAIVLQVGANDEPAFADTIVGCGLKWLNPFGPNCSSTLRGEWPGKRIGAPAGREGHDERHRLGGPAVSGLRGKRHGKAGGNGNEVSESHAVSPETMVLMEHSSVFSGLK